MTKRHIGTVAVAAMALGLLLGAVLIRSSSSPSTEIHTVDQVVDESSTTAAPVTTTAPSSSSTAAPAPSTTAAPVTTSAPTTTAPRRVAPTTTAAPAPNVHRAPCADGSAICTSVDGSPTTTYTPNGG